MPVATVTAGSKSFPTFPNGLPPLPFVVVNPLANPTYGFPVARVVVTVAPIKGAASFSHHSPKRFRSINGIYVPLFYDLFQSNSKPNLYIKT